MKKAGILIAVRGVTFALVFCLAFQLISGILVNPEPNQGMRHYQYVRGFFEEPEDSLDAVFIGASNVYTSWLASVGYKKYGLKIRNLASAEVGGDCFAGIIQNVRQLHPNALYIVSINSFLWETKDSLKHYFLDYWPAARKAGLILDLYGQEEITSGNILEYAVPLVRFHSRWSQLQREDFSHSLNGLKGETVYNGFLNGVTDVSDTFYVSDAREAIDANLEEALRSFLSYCKTNDIRVLFVGIPWAVEERKATMNYVAGVVSSEGFDVINLPDYLNDIGLDPKTDYYNGRHTNIHGALKITDYLAQYLLDHYDFPEKPGWGTRVGISLMKSIKSLSRLT